MTASGTAPASHLLRLRWKIMGLSIAGAIVALVVGANAHLLYVAFASQPDCVPHAKEAGEGRAFRAAAPAC